MAEDTYEEFRWYDYVIFVVTLLTSLGIGVYYALTGGKQRTTKEFHLADRSMGIVPVSLSLFVSGISAVMIMGSTAEFYEHGITGWFEAPGAALFMILGALTYARLVYGMGFTSSFAYLQKRYNSLVLRRLASVLVIIFHLFYMGLSLYTPAIALEGVTGIPFVASVLGTGFVVVIYSAIGGLKAVIGTDTFQGVVMFGGCLLVLILGSIKVGGLTAAWEVAQQHGRMEVNYFYSSFVRMSFWSACIGQGVTYFNISLGQNSMQRIVSVKNTNSAMWVMLLYVPLILLMFTLVYLCGMVVFAYYQTLGCDPLKTGQITSPNQLLPFFIMDGLKIPGIPGLFTAVLFCGALSSVSSSLNALSAITWKDFMEARFMHATELKKATINKLLVLIYGLIGLGMAFIFEFGKGNVMQMYSIIAGATTAPVAGMFVLGILFPWVEWVGALVGLIAGAALTATMSIGNMITFPWGATLPTDTDLCYALGHNVTVFTNGENREAFPLFMISFQWYYLASFLTTVVVGLLVSVICFRQKGRDQDPRLMSPVFDRLCCWMPARWRDVLHCDVPYSEVKVDELGRYDMIGIIHQANDKDNILNKEKNMEITRF